MGSEGSPGVLTGFSTFTWGYSRRYSRGTHGGALQAAGGKSERERRALATREKEKGNEAFKAKEYKEAVVCARPVEHTHTQHGRTHTSRARTQRRTPVVRAHTHSHARTHVRRHRHLGP